MHQKNQDGTAGSPAAGAPPAGPWWWRFLKAREGAAAVEFALLATPYFMLVFAILETFIAYTGEQLVINGVQNMARQMRLGKITAMSETEFRRAFCAEVAILIRCTEEEIETPDRLLIDLRSFTRFADMPELAVPRDGTGDLDTSGFAYAPGTPGSINILRAYYRWGILTDLIRPYISNMRNKDGTGYFLIIGTSVFRMEGSS